MKRNYSVGSFLILSLLLSVCQTLSAQVIDYYDSFYGRIANSNGRVVTTIIENEGSDEVLLEVMAIGYFHLGTVSVSLNYDPTVVAPIYGPGGAEIITRLNGQMNMGAFIQLNPNLPNVSIWRETTTGQIHPTASTPRLNVMTGGAYSFSDKLLPDGEILPICTLYFKKLEGKTLTNTTFTYYERLIAPYLRNEFSLGTTVAMTGQREARTFINSDMFVRRTPSKIETGNAMVNGTSVTLTGVASSEGLERIPFGKGLDWDNIVATGFIYSKSGVALSIDTYSQKIKVGESEYDFPNLTEGVFYLGGYEFQMAFTPNPTGATHINMRETLKHLEAGTPYYAYPFMQYRFQTSNPYPVLGTPLTFTPEFCEPHQVIVNTNADTNICDGETITTSYLQNFIVQEAGYEYLFYMDEVCTEPFTGNLQVDYAQFATHTFYVMARDIAAGCTTDLEDVAAITIAVTPMPTLISTSAPELYLEENETFYLYVEVEGSVTYQWYFEEVPIEGATQFYYSDNFHALQEGRYSVRIEGACATLHADFQLHKMLGFVETGSVKGYKFTVYPNPTRQNEYLNLLLEVPENEALRATAQLFDMNGKRINTYPVTNPLTKIKLNVAEGIYMIRVNTESGREFVTKVNIVY